MITKLLWDEFSRKNWSWLKRTSEWLPLQKSISRLSLVSLTDYKLCGCPHALSLTDFKLCGCPHTQVSCQTALIVTITSRWLSRHALRLSHLNYRSPDHHLSPAWSPCSILVEGNVGFPTYLAKLEIGSHISDGAYSRVVKDLSDFLLGRGFESPSRPPSEK